MNNKKQMNSLAFSSMMTLYNEMSYEESEKFRELLFKDYKKVYRIQRSGHPDSYLVVARNAKEAKDIFMSSKEFLSFADIILYRSCTICKKEDCDKDHIESHTYVEVMSFLDERYWDLFYYPETEDVFDEKENILNSIGVSKFSQEQSTFFKVKNFRETLIEGKSKEDVINKIISSVVYAQILDIRDIYEIHRKYFCNSHQCSKEIQESNDGNTVVITICKDCNKNAKCFMCGKKLESLKNVTHCIYDPHEYFRIEVSNDHFTYHMTHNIDPDILRKYIEEEIYIEEEDVTEYYQISEKLNKEREENIKREKEERAKRNQLIKKLIKDRENKIQNKH